MASDGAMGHTPRMQTTPDRDLDSFLDHVRAAPRETGVLELIVARPERDLRETPSVATLSVEDGLVGDGWRARGSRSRPDGSAEPDAQLTLMSTRVLSAIAPDRSTWPLAGDQLLVDMDLGVENLPPGTRLTVGEAELEITPLPHTGCAKFSARYGLDALRWVSTPTGRDLRMRGVYARVVRGGSIRVGEIVRKA